MNASMEELAQNLIVGVLNSFPAGIALAVMTAVTLRIMRRTPPSARFAIWFFALVILPLLGLLHTPLATVSGAQVHRGINIPGSWAIPAVAAWAAIAGIIMMRVMLGIRRIRNIRRSCVAIAKENLPGAAIAVLSSCPRPVEVCISPIVQVPAAVGLFRPAIVLPEWAMKDLPADQLAVIICHELAHLQRWDDWTNLAQKVLRAVLFFHPAAWWIERRLSLEREMACDDAAVSHAASARDYAASLVAVAEKSMIKRSMLMAQAAVHRARETSLRIARLLKLTRGDKPQSWKPAVVMAGFLATAIFVVEPIMPRLVAFENNGPSVIAVAKTPVLSSESITQTKTESLVVPASFNQSSSAEVVPTKLTTPVRKPALRPAVRKTPAPEMIVIFQNASFDQQGMPTWNVYVLRVKWTENAQPRTPEPSKRT